MPLNPFLRLSDVLKKRSKQSVTMNLRMSPEFYTRLRELAVVAGYPAADVVRRAVTLYDALATTPALRVYVKQRGGELEEITSLLRDS